MGSSMRALVRVAFATAVASASLATAATATVQAESAAVTVEPAPPPAFVVDGIAIGNVPSTWIDVGTVSDTLDLQAAGDGSASGKLVPATITTAKFSTRDAGTEAFVPHTDPFATVSVLRPSTSASASPSSIAGAQLDAFLDDHPSASPISTPIGDGVVAIAPGDELWSTVYVVASSGVIVQVNGIKLPVEDLVGVARSLTFAQAASGGVGGGLPDVVGVPDVSDIPDVGDPGGIQVRVKYPPKPAVWNGEGDPPSINRNCRDYPDQCAQQPWDWRYGEAIGYCNSRSSFRRGGYIISAQPIPWVNGNLAAATDIDGVHGPKTDAAMSAWQQAHGLAADGCFGWDSWTTAQYGTHRVREPGCNCYESYPHMVLTGHVNGRGVYRFEEYSTNRGVLYFIDEYYDPSSGYWHDSWNCVYVRHPGNAYEYTVIEYVFVDECLK